MEHIKATMVGKEVLLLSTEELFQQSGTGWMRASLIYRQVDYPEPPAAIIKDKPLVCNSST